MTENLLSVDGARFWSTIEASAELGKGPRGGLRRLALDESDAAMRRLFIEWCEAAGAEVTVDRLGNIKARRAGREDLPPVMVGSHLDTQASGGRYDGIVGVLAGLEILRCLEERGIVTRRPIEVMDWTNEEGARFQPPMLCSAGFAGKVSLDWALSRKDDAGITLAEALSRAGFDGAAQPGGYDIDSYFELHIEQGPELEAKEVPVGLVVGSYASVGMRLEVTGDTAHAGPTPMAERRDAIFGAALLAVGVNQMGRRYAPEGKATAPRIEAWPNKPGIISERATLYLDFRHPEKSAVEAMTREIEELVETSAAEAQVQIEIAERWSFGGVDFSEDLLDLLRATAREQKIPTLDLLSQAGHDAYNLAAICPTALIFSPCEGGLSHNEREATRLEDQLPALNLLLNAVLARADRP
ncbi:MAG: Zn-dependent hydrolase [Limibacillus sp.]